jgi:hypothetical protein
MVLGDLYSVPAADGFTVVADPERAFGLETEPCKKSIAYTRLDRPKPSVETGHFEHGVPVPGRTIPAWTFSQGLANSSGCEQTQTPYQA